MPESLSKEVIQEITKLTSDFTLKGTSTIEIPEEIMDLMHIYIAVGTTKSLETTQQDGRNLTQLEKLRVLSRNIGSKLKKKPNAKHNFMKQINAYAPHIILVQEHQLSKVRLRELRKMITIKGC